LALAGVPLTSGFLSKDAILGGTLAFAMEHPQHWLLPVFGFAAAGLTAFYMFRLIYLTFYGTFRGGDEAGRHLHESPRVMTAPLLILATLSIFVFYAAPAFNPTTPAGGWFATLLPTPDRAYAQISHHEEHEGNSNTNTDTDGRTGVEAPDISISISHAEHIEHVAHNWAMLISILAAGLGIWIATLTYYQWKINPEKWRMRLGVIYRGMFHKWWCDEVYRATAISGTLGLSQVLARFDLKVIDGIVNGSAALTRGYSFVQGWFDNKVVDGLVNLTAWIVGMWGHVARSFQTGQVQRYILYTLAAVGVVIVVLSSQL